jgi:tetratricopeptide (TPR) repeat protein
VIDGCTAIIHAGQEPREKLATAFDNRGVAYRRKGEYDRALQDYEQAIQLNPSNALYARGLTLLRKGDTEAGKDDISATKAINPNIAEQFDHSETPSR